jgi:hypothetical protein
MCKPGARDCKGQIPRFCLENGTWWEGNACAYQCTNAIGMCLGECKPASTQCAGPTEQDAQVCSQTGNWQTVETCSGRCSSQMCGSQCLLGQPTYCLAAAEPRAELSLCEATQIAQACTGNPTGQPCDPTDPNKQYMYIYQRADGTARYPLVTSRYYVCDWNDQTPPAERGWHEGG